MSWFFIMTLGIIEMQNIEATYVIDLTNCTGSEDLVNKVVETLENDAKNAAGIKLKLDNAEINQSQMIFIKSLIESYGKALHAIETTNPLTKDICIEMGINTRKETTVEDIQNAKLDELREEFKASLETAQEPEKEPEKELEEEYRENETEETAENEAAVQKQVIGVYRKADEKENEAEFQDEDVDFYATPTDEAVVIDTKDTIYVHQTLRNGQILDYDGNVVIIGDCHPGSEIKATGDITVWGVLGSIAHAGIKGNKDARIRALKMNAVQLRIANCYSRRPDGGNIPYIVKSSVFTPEEARIVDDNIVLFKMAQN